MQCTMQEISHTTETINKKFSEELDGYFPLHVSKHMMKPQLSIIISISIINLIILL